MRIEESFRRQLARLPAQTQQLLLVAAAEPLGEPELVWRAAEQLGVRVDAAAPAAAAGLLEIGARGQFRHPLVAFPSPPCLRPGPIPSTRRLRRGTGTGY
jgi:hypothetical protein